MARREENDGSVISLTDDDVVEVYVRAGGSWHFGTLHEWRRDETGRWTGWVRYSVDHIGAIGRFDQDDIEKLEYCPWPDPTYGA